MRLKAILICLLFSIISCSQRKDISSVLSNVEDLIEQHPDSALMILGKVDKAMCSREQYAQYSLLLSMALDKNYIDKTDFSVLQPAIDYYEKKGNPTERMRMYYYQGTIYKNAGDDEKAMECYVKGLDSGELSDDSLTKARMYFSKALIHNALYDYRKYAWSMMEAAKYFKGKKQSSYFNALCNAHNGSVLCRDSLGAATIQNQLAACADSSNSVQLSKLYEARISFLGEFCGEPAVLSEMEEYLDRVPHNSVKWLTVANIYSEEGKYEEAMQSLRNHEKYFMKKDARYYAISSRLYENIGDMHKALEDYKKYIQLSDSADITIFRQDTKFIEERYRLSMEVLEEQLLKQRYIIAGILLLAILCGATVLVRMKLKARDHEIEEFKAQCAHLELERIRLQEVLDKNLKVDEAVKEAILGRLALLDAYFVANIVDDWKGYEDSVDALRKVVEDRADFMESNCMAFRLKYPCFVGYLEEMGLSEMEIRYCCLYALGLSGKEIGAYTKMSRHYKVSSSIRNKLGLKVRDMNLDKYIGVLLERYS